MTPATFDNVPLWCMFLGTIAIIWGALEIGYELGRRRHLHSPGDKDASVSGMVGAILGLLGFMLAFTFGLAASRFDARRMAVLDEANAIGTAYLRTALLPEPMRANAAGLMKQYVDVRVETIETRRIDEGLAKSEVLHRELWQQAVTAAAQSPTPVTSLFVQSVNEVIDIHSTRTLLGLRSRVPLSIWVSLLFLAILGMASVGFQAGLAATRRSPEMVILVLAFSSVLYLIADLDRGRDGFLQVSQQSMLDVQQTIEQSQSAL